MPPAAKAVLDVPSDIRKFSASKFEQTPVFVFVYMRGCPWCDMMKPEWERFKRANVVNTIDVNHMLLDQLKLLLPPCRSMHPNGYPHIQLIKPGSIRNPSYENLPRDEEHFKMFIKKHILVNLPKHNAESSTKPKPKSKSKPKSPTKPKKK